MNRVEILEKVKAQVKEKGTIQYQYAKDGCMCAVGYVLAECGIDVHTVLAESEYLNGRPIGWLVNNESDINSALEEHGIRYSDVSRLQSENDTWSNADVRKHEVIKAIDELIAGK